MPRKARSCGLRSPRQAALSATIQTWKYAGRGPLWFPLSSTSADELRRTAGRLADWLGERKGGNGRKASAELSDLAYTLARRRGHRPVRTWVVAGSHQELIKALREQSSGRGFDYKYSR